MTADCQQVEDGWADVSDGQCAETAIRRENGGNGGTKILEEEEEVRFGKATCLLLSAALCG